MALRLVRSFVAKCCVPGGIRCAQAAHGSESWSSAPIQAALGSARKGKLYQFIALRNASTHVGVSSAPLNSKTTPSKVIIGIATVCSFSTSLLLNSEQAASSTSPESQDEDTGGSPERVDWEERNVLNVPRRQGYCGSCWAIVVIAALEAAWMIRYGVLPKLSVQELIDCCSKEAKMVERAEGCKGRRFAPALHYMKKYGIMSEQDYPQRRRFYGGLGNDGDCLRLKVPLVHMRPVASVSDWWFFEPGEDLLMKGVVQQPLCVELDYPPDEIFNFRGGKVIEYHEWPPVSPESKQRNRTHAVLLLGYDGNKDGKVWKILNTWGPGWGDGGTGFLRRGVADTRGTAGINRYRSFYPILK